MADIPEGLTPIKQDETSKLLESLIEVFQGNKKEQSKLTKLYDKVTKNQEKMMKAEEKHREFLKQSEEMGLSKKEISPMLKEMNTVESSYIDKSVNVLKEVGGTLKKLKSSEETKNLEKEQKDHLEKIASMTEKDIEETKKERKKLSDTKIGKTVGKASSSIVDTAVDSLMGPLQLITQPLEDFFGFNLKSSVKEGAGKAGGKLKETFTKGTGKESEDKDNTKEFLSEKVKPTKSDMLKSGILGASSVYLADQLTESSDNDEGGENIRKLGGFLSKGLLPVGATSAILGIISKALPVALIAGGIGVTVAGLVTAWKNNWDEKGEEEAEKLKSVFADENASHFDKVKASMVFGVKALFGTLVGGLKEAWEGLKSSFGAISDIWSDEDLTTAEKLVATIKEGVQMVLEFPFNILSGFWGTLESYILPLLPEKWQEKYIEWKNKIEPILTGIKEFALSIPNAIIDAFLSLKDVFVKKVEEFEEIWGDDDLSLWEKVKGSIVAIVTTPIEILKAFWGTLISSITKKFNEIFPNASETLTEWNEKFTEWKNQIEPILTGIKDFVLSIPKAIIDSFLALKDVFISKVEEFEEIWGNDDLSLWEKVKKSIVAIVTTPVNMLKAFWGTLISTVTEKFNEIFPNADEKFQEIKTKVSNFFSGVWEGIIGFFSGLINRPTEDEESGWIPNVNEKFQEIKTKVSDFFSGVWEGILGFFSGLISKPTEDKDSGWIPDSDTVWGKIKKGFEGYVDILISPLVDGIKSWIATWGDKFSNMKEILGDDETSIWEKVIGIAKEVVTGAVEAPFNFIKDFVSGVAESDTFNKIKDSILGIFGDIGERIKSFLWDMLPPWAQKAMNHVSGKKGEVKESIDTQEMEDQARASVESGYYGPDYSQRGNSDSSSTPNSSTKSYRGVEVESSGKKEENNFIEAVKSFFNRQESDVDDAIIYKDGKMVRPHPDDNIVAMKDTPRIIERNEVRNNLQKDIEKSYFSQNMPDESLKKFDTMIAVLQTIAERVQNSGVTNVVNQGDSPSFNFDSLRLGS